MNFRKDINGLRAIAVIAVVLFHFNPSWVPGGFAGVDVFFVISGFLMTGIIFRGMEQDNFSIFKFYVARANRIIPALAALCLALLIFGWFYLTSLDYKSLSKHIAGSMSFISNMLYWRESGYFNAASLEKWLLHTWSLSVEWQFYIIYPLVLSAIRKFISKQAIKPMILFGTILSFSLCAIATYKWPDPSYYLLPTRAWEMMIGGLAYLYPISTNERNKKNLELAGIALIIGSYFFISNDTPWPGYIALLPVIGSFLVIQSQRNNSIITGNFIFQKIGTWSYSIYLWHWPLVVAIYYYSLSSAFIYFGLALSILLGFISYKYIEKIKIRNDFSSLGHYLRYKLLYLTLTIITISTAGFLSNGFDFRLPTESQQRNKAALAAIGDWDYPKPNLKIGSSDIRLIKGNTDKNILFIGASHIEQTYPYVKNLNSEYNIYYLTRGGCFVSQSYVNPKWSCENIQNYRHLINNVKFDRIVTSIYTLGGYLSSDEQERKKQIKERTSQYDEFLNFAKERADKVYMILGEPSGEEFDPKLSIRYNLKDNIGIEVAREKHKMIYEQLNNLREISDVTVIDPMDSLCDDVCMVMDVNSNYYYKDTNHMRPWYAKEALGYLDVIFN